LNVDGVEYQFLPLKLSLLDQLLYNLRIGKKMVHAIKLELILEEYDLIHAHWVYPYGYVASLIKKETGIPCIISAIGSDIHTQPYASPKIIPQIISSLDNANMVIFVSNNLYKSAKKLGYNGSNYTVLSYGVETRIFYPMNKTDVRTELNLFQIPSKYIGFIGNLIWVKRADRLPELFQKIAKKHSNFHFIIIGDGNLRSGIEQKCKDYNLDVKFTGRIPNCIPDEMPLWINALDVLVLPSRNEGLPNIILEAQSCGCPVVGSNAGGIPEAIGTGGVVVETDSNFEENFTDAVIEMINNPPSVEQMRDRAMQFDWDRIIKRQLEVYESQIQQNRPFEKKPVE
jgi:glycosyltransferase involved in cell wall biosynthesis